MNDPHRRRTFLRIPREEFSIGFDRAFGRAQYRDLATALSGFSGLGSQRGIRADKRHGRIADLVGYGPKRCARQNDGIGVAGEFKQTTTRLRFCVGMKRADTFDCFPQVRSHRMAKIGGPQTHLGGCVFEYLSVVFDRVQKGNAHVCQLR
ncbi:hypothetical protein [Paraburkholderia sp. HD33-4]|uniref:hypothetical protein n=1 Tax=Paraburkholderia sp. HD33-4 TaxID=2883242 RepID=UPI001F426371|nr:hypothetical protein [Paraburkholderia sp. HD33-4]